MIKRDELKGPSCLTAAEDDEPIFTLRANDEQAPSIVRAWAYAYRNDKILRCEYTPKREAKFVEAMVLAGLMEKWKNARSSPSNQRPDHE